MRYIRVLVIAVFLFFALIFFFQNQGPLSQQMEMTLNLFFIPPMNSISLPFYFLLIAAFFIGCLLSLFWLFWDKVTTSSKLMKSKWEVSRLKNEVAKLQKLVDDAAQKADATKAAAAEGVRALPSAPQEESGKAKKA